jgi:hypothetical protein
MSSTCMGNMYLSTRYPVKSPSYRYFYINAHDRLIHVHARYADYDFWYDLATRKHRYFFLGPIDFIYFIYFLYIQLVMYEYSTMSFR